ncbi:hypothetical protein MP228_007232 [Amoeboaphelidium protococcarum]|nr:hypothetical protein MP228_007232 [Amoeboaphelidium protococcarum]
MVAVDYKRYVNIANSLCFDWNYKYSFILPLLLLMLESASSLLIIRNVPYTEIDWKAYMQEVGQYLGGCRDYSLMKGDTGPLVYPAGFVYIYSLLFQLTDAGQNIRLAQYIFACLYVVSLALKYRISWHIKIVPPIMLPLLSVSKRIHSIYMLRMFNDPVAMLFMYLCVLALLNRKYTVSSILLSVALSVKMNIVLFLPAFMVIVAVNLSPRSLMKHLLIIVAVQLILAVPFLTNQSHAVNYFRSSFNLGRVFDYKWTVNWKFLHPDVFYSSNFHLLLVSGCVSLWCLLGHFAWTQQLGMVKFIYRFLNALRLGGSVQMASIDALNIVTMLALSNLVGICFSRSLHYQFYSWYFWSLPFLVAYSINVLLPKSSESDSNQPQFIVNHLVAWSNGVTVIFTIEYCWNVYPATPLSSAILLCCNSFVLTCAFIASIVDSRRKFVVSKSSQSISSLPTITKSKRV